MVLKDPHPFLMQRVSERVRGVDTHNYGRDVSHTSIGVDRGHDCEVLALPVNPLDGRDHKPCMPRRDVKD